MTPVYRGFSPDWPRYVPSQRELEGLVVLAYRRFRRREEELAFVRAQMADVAERMGVGVEAGVADGGEGGASLSPALSSALS